MILQKMVAKFARVLVAVAKKYFLSALLSVSGKQNSLIPLGTVKTRLLNNSCTPSERTKLQGDC